MEEKKRRIRITNVYTWFIIVLVISSALLLFWSYKSGQSIKAMQDQTNEYIAEQQAIDGMKDASDLLTEKSRSFIATGNVAAAKLYFVEVNVDKNREKTLEELAKYETGDEIFESLNEALKKSNDLAEVECYAMRLAAEGYGIDPKTISKDLAAVKLTDADKALSKREQRVKARNMVFDDNYEAMKDDIIDDVISGLEKLLDDSHHEQVRTYNRAVLLSRGVHIMMFAILICVFALLLLTSGKLIVPMRRSTVYIEKNEPLPTEGAEEYGYLAETYNGMLEKTKRNHEELSYEATHDELTGLFNRKMFENRRSELVGSDIAMLIVDIDYFKKINDENGHEIGDKVLKKVADILQSCFRLEDSVCRIGGDEFCVLMLQMTPDMRDVVKAKIDRVMDKLLIPDDLPKATLSIGVAFYADEGDEDLFVKADKALYNTKEEGRDGYTFYSDIAEKLNSEND